MKSKLLHCLHNATNWDNIYNNIMQNVDNSFSKGKLFEYFCQYYFLVEPSIKDDYTNVWLFDDIPYELRDKLNLSTIDHGIDLILEGKDNSYTAVQCKFRANESSILNWSTDSIAHLIADSDQCDYKIIFTNASGIDKHTISKNVSLIALHDLLEIEVATINNMIMFIEKQRYQTNKATPREYQKNIVNKVCDKFCQEARGQLILPCGTGKTLVSLWIKEKLKARTTLVCLPSLSLLRQTKFEWSKNLEKWQPYLCVCSDETVDSNNDQMIVHKYELGTHVTTDSDDVVKFIRRYQNDEFIIYTTYHSIPVIIKALQNIDLIFDLVVSDEAHKTAGHKSNVFGLVHDDIKLPSCRRLYMTATPRVLSKNLKTRLGEELEYMSDMSNPNIYGSEFFRMTFKEAIDLNILVDYKLLVIGVNNQLVYDSIINGDFININHKVVDYAHNFALQNVMNKYKATHAITFHSTIQRAEDFSNRHKKITNKNIYCTYVSGKQTTNERAQILNAFSNKSIGILSNARCLTEGVDVPNIDLIYFGDSKESKVDIIQAVGRALRKSKINNKEVGYIVVPIFFSDKQNLEEAIKKSQFNNLINIIKAMCDQDIRLQDEINSVKLGKITDRTSSHLDVDIDKFDINDVLILSNFEEKLKKSLFDEIIVRTASNWDIKYNQLKDYFIKTGNVYLSDGHELYTWAMAQRNRKKHGLLSVDRIIKLDNIGFIWSDWDIKYAELLDYKNLNQDLSKINREHKLYSWVNRQIKMYHNGQLSSDKINKLKSIGLFNDYIAVKDAKWQQNYDVLKQFILIYNNENTQKTYTKWPAQRSKDQHEKKLAIWMMSQKNAYKEGRMSSDQFDLLCDINFPFYVQEARWGESFEKVKEYYYNYSKFPDSDDPMNISLYRWCKRNAENYVDNTLEKDQKTLLDEINFQKFIALNIKSNNVLDIFQEKVLAIMDFISNNNRLPAYSSQRPQEEQQLASWIVRQRQLHKNGELLESQIQQLENAGIQLHYEKTVHDQRWDDRYQQLIDYRSINVNKWPSLKSDIKTEVALANWLCAQKNWYNGTSQNISSYPQDRYDKLVAIGFDFAIKFKKAIGLTWEDNFNSLCDLINDNDGALKATINGKATREYAWLSNQRVAFKKGLLIQDRINKLLSIGIDISIDNGPKKKHTWNERFQSLCDFINDNNGILKATVNGKTVKQYNWLYKQKLLYLSGKLAQDKLSRLLNIEVIATYMDNE